MTETSPELQTPQQQLQAILSQSPVLWEIIETAPQLGLAQYYIGAGCICQTVWNRQNGLDPLYGISDIDLAYYDGEDLSYQAEDRVVCRAQALFAHLPVEIDLKNQARVHLWYQDHYGYALAPYPSLEAALATWPTTATAVGVRLHGGVLEVFAPFGLEDLLCQVVRANKVQITQATYLQKCQKWQAKWPGLRVVGWEEG